MSTSQFFASVDARAFDWKRRMGANAAYHMSRANRVVYWLCIPLELWSVVKLLSLVPLAGPMDRALVVIGATSPIYVAIEPLLGSAMAALLLACRWSASPLLPHSRGVAALLAITPVTANCALQVGLGHGIFEGGRYGTGMNLVKLTRTKKPVPILVVFYYYLVEVALIAGYRPVLRREIEHFTTSVGSAGQ